MAYEYSGYLNYSKALPQYQKQLSPNNQFTYYFTNQGGGKVYASGFNQEGLQVSPRGLEDITTGQVLSLEDIGNPDRDIDFPEFFQSLGVDQLTVNNLQVNGTVSGADATTTEKGIVQYATPEITRLLAARDRAVTPFGLNGVRGFANTFASLDESAKVPVEQLPRTAINQLLKLTPVPWVRDADNFANSSNFTFEQTTDRTLVMLGAPITEGHVGSSGFINVTRGQDVITKFGGIDNDVWKPVVNTWVSPVDNTPGLPGNIKISYQVAAIDRIDYNVSMLT